MGSVAVRPGSASNRHHLSEGRVGLQKRLLGGDVHGLLHWQAHND